MYKALNSSFHWLRSCQRDMARLPRLVVPGFPHHVTQRGNRRQTTFFCNDDYTAYLDLIAEHKAQAGVTFWAYCLMPNHVHLIAIPEEKDSLARLFRRVHRLYTLRVNQRERWTGHLWQERFHSFVMDESHLLAAVRYTELNPVRAGLCQAPEEWVWSSTNAHLSGRDDNITTVKPMLQRVSNWREFLATEEPVTNIRRIRAHSSSGRPAGDSAFVERLESMSGRNLKKRRPGPKAKPGDK